MNTNTDIEKLFEEALHKATEITYPLPDDIRLRLYAYYKRATQEPINIAPAPHEHKLINAFKMNAWMQVRQLSVEEAKLEYVKLIDELHKSLKK
ncbi:MAG TPA: acyl-CoA-binding protein [Flavobacterium sp.]|nr:acyl-CoA-binding protein [Flavobacterium sp.]